jgi:hypothetical protein
MQHHITSDAFSITPILSRKELRRISASFLSGAVSDLPSVDDATSNDVGDSSAFTLSTCDDNDKTDFQPSTPVRAPLKFIGPYAVLGLSFPDLATSSQRARNLTGIALDFVLDTAANINTLNGQVAQELNLEVVAEAPGGMSASGPMAGGDTYLLGKCQLEGLGEEDQFTFMENLTASALPLASPAAAGLLSLPFFHCFEGGVEFEWNGKQLEDGQRLPPSITFYGSEEESMESRQYLTQVPIEELPHTRLPVVKININGVIVPALFDTGSPITVLNSQAAEQAGISTIKIGTEKKKDKNNPFETLASKFKDSQVIASAAARGDILSIAGTAGQRVDLFKSESMVDLSIPSDHVGAMDVDFGSRHVYVGNIPGLAALNGLGDESPPAAVLGMDVLRSKSKMLLMATKQKVYF